jgi:hypothetical protein
MPKKLRVTEGRNLRTCWWRSKRGGIAADCSRRAKNICPELSVRLSPVRLDVGDPADKRSDPMQYLLMIYSNEVEYAKIDPATSQKIMAEYETFTKGIIQSGNFKAGDRLRPTSTATTVRVKDGKVMTTDGPFAETREQLGGYYLIEAKDLDAALGIAAKIPGARYGSIEVRPIWVYG